VRGMSYKRRRTDEEEACEALGGLLRQAGARAIERVRFLRQQRLSDVGGGLGVSVLTVSAAEAVSRTAKPMDVLVIRFCMHYLDCSEVAGVTQFVRLAQNLVTSSVERVLVPQLFAKSTVSLPSLCESLVAEHTAEDIQTAVKEINEFVEARGALGVWLAEAAESARFAEDDDDDNYGPDVYGDGYARGTYFENEDTNHLEREEGGNMIHVDAVERADTVGATEQATVVYAGEEFALASTLFKACEFWVRVQAFLNALSLHSARLHVFKMPPRYERELLLLLYSATRGTEVSSSNVTSPGATRPLAPGAAPQQRTAGEEVARSSVASVKNEGIARIKEEPWSNPQEDVYAPGDAAPYHYNEDELETDGDNGALPASPTCPPRQLYKASALLADVLALSRCPQQASSLALTSAPAETMSARLTMDATQHLKGVNPSFYQMVYARLGVMVARDCLHRFDQSCSVTPPELTVQQKNLQEQLQQQQSANAAAANPFPGQMEAGLPTSYIPDDAYYDKLIHQQHDTIEEDEEVYKGEVMDYYLTHPGRYTSVSAGASGTGSSRSRHHGGSRNNNNGKEGEEPLIKPHRFCKVKTGFSWTQYNRTHYDSRTNPPPRTEMWYEFTLFYPALANTKRDMRHIFRIEDAPEGPNDQYCLLVFSVGPPYADVAYRIRKKQWDTRRGGVRISFDQTGRYKLFFRFTNSNYRR
jgi:hypothetical protein